MPTGSSENRSAAEPGLPPAGGARLGREFLTMRRMVEIHCSDRHGSRRGRTCADCDEFLAYVQRRLEKCPYGEDKPTCAKCPIHCYKPARREMAREIMRHAGPRMPLRHPWLSLLHVLDKLRQAEHPMDVRRRERE